MTEAEKCPPEKRNDEQQVFVRELVPSVRPQAPHALGVQMQGARLA